MQTIGMKMENSCDRSCTWLCEDYSILIEEILVSWIQHATIAHVPDIYGPNS